MIKNSNKLSSTIINKNKYNKNNLNITNQDNLIMNKPQQTQSKVYTKNYFNNIGYFTKQSKLNCLKQGIIYNSPLIECLKNKKDNEITIKYDEEVGSKTHTKYINISYQDLEKYSWNVNNHLFEIIPEGASFKFYLDIDKRFLSFENNKLILKQVFKLMKNEFNFNIDIDNYSMAHGMGDKENYRKVSWHIIFEDIIIKNMDEGKKIIKHLYYIIETNDDYLELRNGILDIHPYTNNQSFKLPYQTKAFKNIKQIPTNPNKKLSNFLLTNTNSTNFFDTSNFKEVEVKPYRFKTKNGTQNTIPFSQGLVLKALKDNVPKNFILPHIDNKIKRNSLEYYLKSIPNNENIPHIVFKVVGYCISNITKNSEEGLKLWTEWTSKYKNISIEELRPIYESNSIDKGYKYPMLINLASIYNKNIGKGTNIMESLFNDKPTYLCDYKNINSRYNGNSLQIKNIVDNYDIINIKAPMGCGKSWDLKTIFKNTNYSVCYLSCKRAFASSMIHDFKEFGFKNYMDIENKNLIINENRIICSIESIQYCRNKYDFLIIDESESICDNLCGAMFTKNKPIEGAMKLHDMILTTKKILVMDAYLTTRSFDFIKDIFKQNIINKKCIYIKNDFKYPVRKFIEHNPETFNLHLKQLLLKKKRCAICCGSKNMANKIMRFIETNFNIHDLKILYYNNENPLPNGVNLNEEWKKADLVIYTPTITAGISYDNKKYPFDNLFLYAVNSHSCHFRDMIQASKRIRDFNDNIINICISADFNYSQELRPCLRETIEENNEFKSLLFDKEEDIKSFKNIEKLEYLHNINIHNILERNINDKYLEKFSNKYLYEENIHKLENNLELEGEFDDTEFDDNWDYDSIKDISIDDKLIIQEKMNSLNNTDIITEEVKKEFIKFNYKNIHTKDNTNEIVLKQFFNKFYTTDDDRSKNGRVRQFINMLNQIKCSFINFNSWRDETAKGKEIYGKPLEIYEMKIKVYEHITKFFDKLGFFKDNKFDINTEFCGDDFKQFIKEYSEMDIKTLNSMLEDSSIKTKKKGDLKQNQIKGIFNQLLRNAFGMEVMGIRTDNKRINGKKKTITYMAIRNFIHKDNTEKDKLLYRSNKYNKFNIYKNDFSINKEHEFLEEEEEEQKPIKKKIKFKVKMNLIDDLNEISKIVNKDKPYTFKFKSNKKTENISGQNIGINLCITCNKSCFNTQCLKCIVDNPKNIVC